MRPTWPVMVQMVQILNNQARLMNVNPLSWTFQSLPMLTLHSGYIYAVRTITDHHQLIMCILKICLITLSNNDPALVWISTSVGSGPKSPVGANCIKILLYVFKCLNNSVPFYLSDLVHRYVLLRSLRSANQLLLMVSNSQPKLWGDKLNYCHAVSLSLLSSLI